MQDREPRQRLAEPAARTVRGDARLRRMQPRLAVGAVDDPLEREADQIADVVLRGLADPVLAAPGLFDAVPPTRIRRSEYSALSSSGGSDDGRLDGRTATRVRRASVAPPDPATQSRMDAGFGAALSGVRVHAGAEPATVNRSSPNIIQREDLADLVVKTGSLPDLKGAEQTAKDWADLSKIVKPLHKNPETAKQIPTPYDYAEVGVISVEPVTDKTETWAWSEKGKGGAAYDSLDGTITPSMLSVIKGLMNNNGQMAYIRAQPWFQNKQWKLGIDVNYYPDRGLSQDRRMFFHKDTGGNNIFVNLIFNNTTEIPATEYLIDVHNPSVARDKHQTRILPPEHRDELRSAREKLRRDPRAKQESLISGGVVGPMNYISWVDDLVWHETPQMAPRALDNEGTAKVVFDRLQKEVKAGRVPAPYYPSLNAISRVLGTPLWSPTARTDLSLVKSNPQARETLLKDMASKWVAGYGNKGFEVFWTDCQKVVDWSSALTPWFGEAIADDPRLGANRANINEWVHGTKGGRRRANSMPETQEKVQKAFDKASSEPRSFIRTWVRIVKNTK